LSGIAGQIILDLTVQYVVPLIFREATSFAAKATSDRSSSRVAPSSPPARLQLVTASLGGAAVSVVSQTPGRVRLHVDGLRGDTRCESAVASVLGRLSGVGAVRSSRLTGNVLVEYDPSRLTVAQILTTLESSGAPADGRPAVRPTIGATAQKKARHDDRQRLALVGA
jgi:copper chaperone CopZ